VITDESRRLLPPGRTAGVQQKGVSPSESILPFAASRNCATAKIPQPRLLHPRWHPATGLAAAKQLQGKETLLQQLRRPRSRSQLVAEFEGPAAVIIKHNNPAAPPSNPLCSMPTRRRSPAIQSRVRRCAGVQVTSWTALTAEEVVKLFRRMHRRSGVCRSAHRKFLPPRIIILGCACQRNRKISDSRRQKFPVRDRPNPERRCIRSKS